MERLAYQRLLSWKQTLDRKPLLLQGARQVGKTYLLKEFASREYKELAYFNFEENPDLSSLFKTSLKADSLIEQLSAYLGWKIKEDSTLIFLDEIQESPRALTSLKYFYEEAPHYHITAAGSLLGVSVGKTSSFPVGKVDFMQLYPMNFFEYLLAQKKDLLLKQMRKQAREFNFADPLHNQLFNHLRFYLYLGGMPEVVQSYIDNQNIEEVRVKQAGILEAFKRDFSKHSSASEAIRISEVWNSIPGQLARENKKFIYKEVKKGGRAARYQNSIEWLKQAGLINLSYNLKVPRLPLSGYANSDKFKIYLFDTGILGAMLNISSRSIVKGNELFSHYNGAFLENFIASELISSLIINELYYWTSQSDAELDFIISVKDLILPLEVKSGMSRRKKSLQVYQKKFKPIKILRASPRNFYRDKGFFNIPLYAIGLIPDMISCR